MLREIWPGPMEGVVRTEFVRAVNCLHLTECWMTPFFRVSQDLPKMRRVREFLAPFAEGGVPVTVQVMGSDPQLLGETGTLFFEAGACGINLNCGCPSARVVSGGAGGGMLRHAEKIAGCLAEMRNFLPAACELSVKIRAGWESPDEMSSFLPQIASSGSVSRIFFHCRTVKELYDPLPAAERSARFRLAASLTGKIPLILNGDFSGVAETESLCAETGSAGAMIARAWLRDPYLLKRFRKTMPDAESGRQALWDAWTARGLPAGAKIEAARMLWGKEDPRFLSLIARR